jgi:putative glutamine amidotransferase
MDQTVVNRRPVIGVTGPDRGGFPAWAFTWLAVRRAGGRPVRLRPGDANSEWVMRSVDGLVLGGGADVDPELYAATPVDPGEIRPHSRRTVVGRLVASWLLAPFVWVLRRLFSLGSMAVDPARDRFEETCLRQARETGIPVLGICRGAQFLNIQHGGSLHTNLFGFYGESGNIASLAPRKLVRIEAGSQLHAILGPESMVNSLHRQAVNRLGSGLVPAARDSAGVIQAIENPDHPFLIGVQWHPEYLPVMPDQQRIFRRLVEAARRCARLPADEP